jgi:hypothetical protein
VSTVASLSLLVCFSPYKTHAFLTSPSTKAYDHLLTLDLEISQIWSSKWTITKVLFLITRYLPYVDGAVSFVCKGLLSVLFFCKT